MNKYTSILLILFLGSCNPGHYKSVRIDSGLKPGEFHDVLLFPRSSIGLCGGYTSKNLPWGTGGGYGRFNAICWRTIDGGRNWTAQKITDGSFSELTIKDDIVYALIITGGGQEINQNKIYESRDLGKTWKFKCAIREWMIRMHVMDSNRIIGNIEGKLRETRDGGKTWDILQTKNFIYHNFYHNKYAYYLSSSKRDAVLDILGRKNLDTGEERIMTLPDGFSGRKGKENLVFCNKGDEVRAYRINDDFTLTYLSSIKKVTNVDYIGIYKEHIFIFAGLSSLDESFYYSSNSGKSWKRLGGKGLITTDGGEITDYTDSTGFKVLFYRDIFSLGTFSVPAEKE